MSYNFTDHPNIISQVVSIKIVLSFCAVLVSVMTLVCNALLICVIVRSRVLQTPTNPSSPPGCGEVLTGIFAIPFAAASVIAEAQLFSETAWCVAVSRPLRYSHILTTRTSCLILACIWLVGLIMAVLPLTYWGSYRFDDAYYMCILVKSGGKEQHLVKEIVCSFNRHPASYSHLAGLVEKRSKIPPTDPLRGPTSDCRAFFRPCSKHFTWHYSRG
ncbi:hypothetical protein Btru_013185 [Bulinus truncatus]|nr:hypothetical protein Btru_013185 [Bulinus truncatus]